MERAAPAGRAARFREWFRRYGMVTVFVPAMIPVPMPLKLFVISAGVMGTPLAEFITVTLIARVIRYFGLAWLGFALGRDSAGFLKSHAWWFGIGALILFAALYGFVMYRERRATRA